MEDIFTLLDEHRVVRATLTALEDAREAARGDGGGYLSVVSLLIGKLAFLVLELHHPREEVVLRVVRERGNVPESTLNHVLMERKTATRLLKRVESRLLSSEPPSPLEMAEMIRQYVETARRVLDAEETLLYPALCMVEGEPDVVPDDVGVPMMPFPHRHGKPTILFADD